LIVFRSCGFGRRVKRTPHWGYRLSYKEWQPSKVKDSLQVTDNELVGEINSKWMSSVYSQVKHHRC